MNQRFFRTLMVVLAIFSGSASLSALTQMIAVQIEFSQGTISPDGLNRARTMALDVESALMDKLFDAGHITFNTPPELHWTGTETALSAVENLLFQTKRGGATLLVLCRVGLSEPKPNQALTVESCAISAIPIYAAADFPLTWNLPVNPALKDTDLKTKLQGITRLLVAKLDNFSATEPKLSLGK